MLIIYSYSYISGRYGISAYGGFNPDDIFANEMGEDATWLYIPE